MWPARLLTPLCLGCLVARSSRFASLIMVPLSSTMMWLALTVIFLWFHSPSGLSLAPFAALSV